MSAPDRDSVAFLLNSVAIHLVRYSRVEDRLAGQSPARLSALSVLVFGGPQTLGSLAAAEQVAPPTMSRLVSGLERDGLATRTPHPTDGRVVMIEATAAGRAMLEEGRERRVKQLRALLERLDDAEVAMIERAMARLQGEIEARLNEV